MTLMSLFFLRKQLDEIENRKRLTLEVFLLKAAVSYSLKIKEN